MGARLRAPVDEHDDAPIEALQQAICDLHGAESTFIEAVKVKDVFQRKVVWEGHPPRRPDHPPHRAVQAYLVNEVRKAKR
jgi:hypothetical protein